MEIPSPPYIIRAAQQYFDIDRSLSGVGYSQTEPFSNRPAGTALWYENSNGLAEIAVNQGRADGELGLAIGSPVEIVL